MSIEQKEKLGESKTKPATGELSESTKSRFLDFIDTRMGSGTNGDSGNIRRATHPVSDKLIQLLPVSSITYSSWEVKGETSPAKPVLGSLGLEEPPAPPAPEDRRRGTITFSADVGQVAAPGGEDEASYAMLTVGMRDDGSAFVAIGGEDGHFRYNPAGDAIVEGYLDRIEAAEQVGGISGPASV